MYATLLLWYLWLLAHSEHGVSDRGVIPIIEWLPVGLLAVQAARPLSAIWWLLITGAVFYLALILMTLISLGAPSAQDLYKILSWIWMCGVLYVGRPRAPKLSGRDA